MTSAFDHCAATVAYSARTAPFSALQNRQRPRSIATNGAVEHEVPEPLQSGFPGRNGRSPAGDMSRRPPTGHPPSRLCPAGDHVSLGDRAAGGQTRYWRAHAAHVVPRLPSRSAQAAPRLSRRGPHHRQAKCPPRCAPPPSGSRGAGAPPRAARRLVTGAAMPAPPHGQRA